MNKTKKIATSITVFSLFFVVAMSLSLTISSSISNNNDKFTTNSIGTGPIQQLNVNENIYYSASVNGGNNTINTTIQNASLTNDIVKASANSYIVWSNNNESPIRGISSISLSYTNSETAPSGTYYFYFSYNHLTLDDILDGCYYDLEVLRFNHVEENNKVITFDVNKLNHRYFLLVYGASNSDAYYNGLSVTTPCADEPYRDNKSVGLFSDYDSNLRSQLPNHVPFIGNGSYFNFDIGGSPTSIGILCLQRESVFDHFVNQLISNGYIMANAVSSKKYYQKDVGNGLFYTISVQPNMIVLDDLYVGLIVFLGEQSWMGSELANGYFDYSSDYDKKIEIMGKLEKNAMENFLTGIPLAQNDGYMRFSSRISLATNEYIYGYGFGVLSEGNINGTLPNVSNNNYPTYLQTATSSDPLSINAWDASGSQIADLNNYISAPYWGKRMNNNHNGYEYYPVLAKDQIGGVDYRYPIHNEPDNQSNLYKKWKVYVKTGEEEGIKYRINSSLRSNFNNRLVQLEDYEFVFEMLLTGNTLRGSELANSLVFKGFKEFNNRSKNIDDINALDSLWNEMKSSGDLGIRTGFDSNGSFIEFEFITAVDEFNAMYTLSKNLYSPIPKEFLLEIGNGDIINGINCYGSFQSYSIAALDNTLCLGPYYLERWNKNQDIVFSLNNDWYEVDNPNRFNIPGIRIVVLQDASYNSDSYWNHFQNGELDQIGIPMSKLQYLNENDKRTIGDSVIRLNVNSCTQDRWNSLFGYNGSVRQGYDNEYHVKPWMSNKNFLYGIFWSINRENFARSRGMTPSINCFSDTYLSNPLTGVSYNSTDAHQTAIKGFHNYDGHIDDYGYNKEIASNYFRKAVEELKASGQISIPSNGTTTINIDIWWMYQTDINEYGNEIAGYIKSAFEDESVSNGKVKIVFNQNAPTQWEKIYTDHLMVGKFDLAFGNISGDTLNPLAFFETLKSDNSSGFTINWGADTSAIDPYNPIVYNNKMWSFDSLWSSAYQGEIVQNGTIIEPANYGNIQNMSTNRLYEGGSFDIPLSFVDFSDTDVEFELSTVELYLAGGGVQALSASLTNGLIHIDISYSQGQEINELLVYYNNLEKAAEKAHSEEQRYELLHPFTYQNYSYYWSIEIKYTITSGVHIIERTLYI